VGSRCISTTARGLPLRTYFLQSSYYRRILTTNSPPEPMTNTHRPPPRLCAWAGMAAGMRSAPQVSAKGELHTSPATGGAMWAASPYSALCTDSTGCQDGSAQAEESVSRCGEGKALRSQLRRGAAMSGGVLPRMYTPGQR